MELSSWVSPLCLLLFWTEADAFIWGWGESDRLNITNVQNLTFTKGEMTTGWRSPSVPQQHCVGGNASCRWEPDQVICFSRSTDGFDVEWECKAEINYQYKFGTITINCEGYKNPEDPDVLRGSCWLEYNLEWSVFAWCRIITLLLMIIVIILSLFSGKQLFHHHPHAFFKNNNRTTSGYGGTCRH